MNSAVEASTPPNTVLDVELNNVNEAAVVVSRVASQYVITLDPSQVTDRYFQASLLQVHVTLGVTVFVHAEPDELRRIYRILNA